MVFIFDFRIVPTVLVWYLYIFSFYLIISVIFWNEMFMKHIKIEQEHMM